MRQYPVIVFFVVFFVFFVFVVFVLVFVLSLLFVSFVVVSLPLVSSSPSRSLLVGENGTGSGGQRPGGGQHGRHDPLQQSALQRAGERAAPHCNAHHLQGVCGTTRQYVAPDGTTRGGGLERGAGQGKSSLGGARPLTLDRSARPLFACPLRGPSMRTLFAAPLHLCGPPSRTIALRTAFVLPLDQLLGMREDITNPRAFVILCTFANPHNPAVSIQQNLRIVCSEAQEAHEWLDTAQAVLTDRNIRSINAQEQVRGDSRAHGPIARVGRQGTQPSGGGVGAQRLIVCSLCALALVLAAVGWVQEQQRRAAALTSGMAELADMFPGVPADLVRRVLEQHNYNVDSCIEPLLAISDPSSAPVAGALAVPRPLPCVPAGLVLTLAPRWSRRSARPGGRGRRRWRTPGDAGADRAGRTVCAHARGPAVPRGAAAQWRPAGRPADGGAHHRWRALGRACPGLGSGARSWKRQL